MQYVSKQTLKSLNILLATGFAIAGATSTIVSINGLSKVTGDLKSITTISLVFSIIILVFAIVGIVVNAIESDFAKYIPPIMVFIIAIGNLVVGFATIDMINKSYRINVPVSASMIYVIVAVIVMAILGIVAVFLNKSILYDNNSKLLSLIAYVIYFNIMTVTVVIETPAETMNFIDWTFNFTVSVYAIVVMFIEYIAGLNPYTPSKHVSVAGLNNKTHNRDVSTVDERLAAIKNLYEKGLITQEEFERKREEILRNV